MHYAKTALTLTMLMFNVKTLRHHKQKKEEEARVCSVAVHTPACTIASSAHQYFMTFHPVFMASNYKLKQNRSENNKV